MKNRRILFAVSLAAAITIGMVTTSGTQERSFPANTDVPPIGHTDPAHYNHAENAHDGAGSLDYFTLLDGEVMDTDYLFYHRGTLNAKSSIGEHLHRFMEEMYIVFDAPVEYTVNGKTALLPARSMVLCPAGSSHGIYNPTDRDLQWMNIGIGPAYDAINFGESLTGKELVSPAPFLWANFDRSLLRPAAHAHDGKGAIMFRRLWANDSFNTNWYFVDHCLLPPDTSIGYHQHNTIEEVYYVIEGNGYYTVNDRTFEAGPGDALPCRLHDSHGLYNYTDQPLEIMVVSVAAEKGVDRWTKNWGDDLSDRAPESR